MVRILLTIATKSDPKQREPREVVNDRRNPESDKKLVHQDMIPLPFSSSPVELEESSNR
jgi:hypothetical protein